MWGVMKKKAISTVKAAHGVDVTNNEPRWISSLTTLHNTDLVASGSHDGFLRLWKSEPKQRKLSQVAEVYLGSILHPEETDQDGEPPGGFVNSISIHRSGKAVILGVGQEHRLGRWWRYKRARNGILVVGLSPTDASEKFDNL